MTAVNRTEMFREARHLRKGMEVEVWIANDPDHPEYGHSEWAEITRYTEITAPYQAVVFTLAARQEFARHPREQIYSRRTQTDQESLSLRDRIGDRLSYATDRRIHCLTADITAPRWTR